MRDTVHISQAIATHNPDAPAIAELSPNWGKPKQPVQKAEYTEQHANNFIQYCKRVFQPRMKQTAPPTIKQEMDYKNASKDVKARIVDRAYDIAVSKGLPEYEIRLTPEQGAVIANLIRWHINDPTSTLPLGAGYWLHGAPGVFKTEIVKILAEFAKERNLSKSAFYTDMSLEYDIAQMGNYDINHHLIQGNRILDEFAKNLDPIMDFGNKKNIYESAIAGRYDRFKKWRQFTCIVSNHPPSTVRDLISKTAFDRLGEMVNSIHMPGESNRRNTT